MWCNITYLQQTDGEKVFKPLRSFCKRQLKCLHGSRVDDAYLNDAASQDYAIP